uniref:hypothetical protein n=1 Tax=Anaerosporobacter sp. TaxID=1872529 RepID=UPI00286ECBFF
TLYEEATKEQELDLVYGGYKQYENGSLLGLKDKRQADDISYKYILKGELVLFNKIIRRRKLEEFVQLEAGQSEQNFIDTNIWNTYGLSLRIISSCDGIYSCNAVLFHQILQESQVICKYKESNLASSIMGIEKTLQWCIRLQRERIPKQHFEQGAIDKWEYIFTRIGLELIQLTQNYWLYSNQILPIFKKYKNSIRCNLFSEVYPSSSNLFESISNLRVDAIPRILYIGAFHQDDTQEHIMLPEGNSFKELGNRYLLNSMTCHITENAIVQKAFSEGNFQFVEEYFAVKSIVKTGGYYIGQDTSLLDTLDGLGCYESVIGFEDRTTISTGFFGARKGHPIWKAILASYEEECFEQMGYLSLSERIRMYLIGMEEVQLDGKSTILKSGIFMLSPEQCVIPRYYELKSEMRQSLCIIDHTNKAADEDYIVIKKSTLEYLLSTANDARMMNKLKSNNTQLKKKLDQLLTSRSIRLTKPLRSGYQRLKNLSHVFRG